MDTCEDINCELQLTFKNNGPMEVEQSITLLQEESVIALDDSIWGVYEINELSKRSHFYFVPRSKDKSVTILFHT